MAKILVPIITDDDHGEDSHEMHQYTDEFLFHGLVVKLIMNDFGDFLGDVFLTFNDKIDAGIMDKQYDGELTSLFDNSSLIAEIKNAFQQMILDGMISDLGKKIYLQFEEYHAEFAHKLKLINFMIGYVQSGVVINKTFDFCGIDVDVEFLFENKEFEYVKFTLNGIKSFTVRNYTYSEHPNNLWRSSIFEFSLKKVLKEMIVEGRLLDKSNIIATLVDKYTQELLTYLKTYQLQYVEFKERKEE